MPLHDYQEQAHRDAVAVLAAKGKGLFVAPTGAGKSFVQAANHDALGPAGLVTVAPSLEILLGIYCKTRGADPTVREWGAEKQAEWMQARGLWTVMRLHNALMNARIDPPPMLQFDEAHHTTAGSYETLHALCGDCPAVAYTATGFRGTPEETAKLKAKWGEPRVVISLKEAVRRGVVARPDMRVWPLLNDETIKVTNGEFETKAVESKLTDVAEDLCLRIRSELCEYIPAVQRPDGFKAVYLPHRATMITAPGVASARHITHLLRKLDVPAICVTGDEVDGMPAESRQEAFRRVTNREAILVQVNVVSEGVDLPIRVQVDAAPTMSPVRWMQRVGRGTRPTEETPLYIATNHNIARHAYLWAGVLPSAQVKEAQQAWGPDFEPSRRLLARAIGLEGFGKFTVSQVPLVDGSHLSLYALQTPNGTHQFAVLLHACVPEPQFYQRTNPHTGELAEKRLDDGRVVVYKKKDYGPWKRVSGIPNLDGYVSTKPGPVTPPMMDWWTRSAERCGLDPAHVPNNREFQVLPILVNTRTRFKVEDCS